MNNDTEMNEKLAGAWLDGFIKECEDRGVDPERLLGVLIKGQEQEENEDTGIHQDA